MTGPSPESMLPAVYAELRRLAGHYLGRERRASVQATELVHEAYLRLLKDKHLAITDRAHFVALAAISMRRLLVERARARGAAKRGGHEVRVTLEEHLAPIEGPSIDLIMLDSALTKLEALDADKARVVELRYFGGLGVEETAQAMGISPATVKRHWAFAKAWLLGELGGH